MFSATMPPAIEKIARHYLRQPAYVYIGDQSSSKENIQQQVIMLKLVHGLAIDCHDHIARGNLTAALRRPDLHANALRM